MGSRESSRGRRSYGDGTIKDSTLLKALFFVRFPYPIPCAKPTLYMFSHLLKRYPKTTPPFQQGPPSSHHPSSSRPGKTPSISPPCTSAAAHSCAHLPPPERI